jgi:hypothetical protein
MEGGFSGSAMVGGGAGDAERNGAVTVASLGGSLSGPDDVVGRVVVVVMTGFDAPEEGRSGFAGVVAVAAAPTGSIKKLFAGAT